MFYKSLFMQRYTVAHSQTVQQYSHCALEGHPVKLKLSVTMKSARGQRSLSAVKCQARAESVTT